jgi:hypothetical protein
MKEEEEGPAKGTKKDELVWGPWKRIFSTVVLEGLDMKSKRVKTVAKVTLPGRVM